MDEKYVALYKAHKLTGIGRDRLESWIKQGKIPAIRDHQSGKKTYTMVRMSAVKAALLKMEAETAA